MTKMQIIVSFPLLPLIDMQRDATLLIIPRLLCQGMLYTPLSPGLDRIGVARVVPPWPQVPIGASPHTICCSPLLRPRHHPIVLSGALHSIVLSPRKYGEPSCYGKERWRALRELSHPLRSVEDQEQLSVCFTSRKNAGRSVLEREGKSGTLSFTMPEIVSI